MNRRDFLVFGGSASLGLIISGCRIPISVDSETLEEKCGVPDYYFVDFYLNNKITRVKELLSKGDCDAFVFITDTHWENNTKNSSCLLKYINRNTGIKRLFIGGDLGNVFGKDSYNCIESIKKSWDGEIHCVAGNHEYLGDNIPTENDVRILLNTNPDIQIGNLDRHYYYVDDNCNNTRYIILSAYAQRKEGNTAANVGYETEQLRWLNNEALSVQAATSIVIFTHLLYYIETDDTISCPYFTEPVIDIIDSYTGPGIIKCVIQGHNHRDRVVFTPRNKIPVFITTCDKYLKLGGEQMRETRLAGTTEEQALDVFVINKFERLIHAVRFGALAEDGIENERGHKVEERIIEY